MSTHGESQPKIPGRIKMKKHTSLLVILFCLITCIPAAHGEILDKVIVVENLCKNNISISVKGVFGYYQGKMCTVKINMNYTRGCMNAYRFPDTPSLCGYTELQVSYQDNFGSEAVHVPRGNLFLKPIGEYKNVVVTLNPDCSTVTITYR